VSNIFSKLRDLVVGPNDAYDDPYEYEEDGDNYDNEYSTEPPQNTPEEEMRQRRRSQRLGMSTDVGMGGKMSNVIDMPGAMNGNYEVVLMEPTSFEEMPQAIQALRERKMVVLNLTMMEPDQAQRAVDFVAGGTYAMDGHQERVGESIFLFTPLCVQVTTQSGLLHEAPQTAPVRPQRVNAPTPSWTGESTRIAHLG
jgi:cell division inhibitor SepF